MSFSTESRESARALRIAGVIVLLLIQASCGLVVEVLRREAPAPASSREAQHGRLAALAAPPPLTPAATGYVEWFDDDTIVIMTTTARRRVRTDAYTVYFTANGRARASDLRPGAGLIVTGADAPDGTLLADVIIVGALLWTRGDVRECRPSRRTR